MDHEYEAIEILSDTKEYVEQGPIYKEGPARSRPPRLEHKEIPIPLHFLLILEIASLILVLPMASPLKVKVQVMKTQRSTTL